VPTILFPCPCCGSRTSQRLRRAYDICPVCFWEDDPVQFDDPDYEGGANVVSLNEARRNFREFGASEQRFIESVRSPTPEEQAK
jgi:hypothetical protein